MGPNDSDPIGTVTRWKLAQTAIRDLVAEISKHKPEGVQIMFLNSKRGRHGIKTAEELDALFEAVEPTGYTPIGAALRKILPYQHFWSTWLALSSVRKRIIVVVTDGRPTKGLSRKSERYTTSCAVCGGHSIREIGIQFVQVGNDQDAAHYLQDLDDSKEFAVVEAFLCLSTTDIVDATSTTSDGRLLGCDLVKAVVGAIVGVADQMGSAGKRNTM
ncbi:hypothetical protein B0H10DRAFT_1963995 [Mycena sp. CBHHK59/15]|nr:hypothetical protein B0H10DRAFT_1963995 [Mycena sp. CBHHK59/15]